MRFFKYHALGNDYVVIDAGEFRNRPIERDVRAICDRHRGIGADGVLIADVDPQAGKYRLRIFNPDGGEAEKSGNGLRIFARHLWDRGLVDRDEAVVEIAAGTARATVLNGGKRVRVEMGRPTFWSDEIPMTGPRREVIAEALKIGNESLTVTAVSVGNPHCVVFRGRASKSDAMRLGPMIEVDPRFPKRTNVQFAHVEAPDRISIEIWERGAGYTLSSGSSSVATVAAAHRQGLCAGRVTVTMPGGTMDVDVGDDASLFLTGDVRAVADGMIAPEVFLES